MTGNLAADALLELAAVLEPLTRLDTPERTVAFVRRLGFDLTEDLVAGVDLGALATAVTTLIDGAAAVVEAASDEERTEAALDLVTPTIEAINALRTAAPGLIAAITSTPGHVADAAADQAGVVFRRILDHLVYQYLYERRPGVFAVLHVLGIAETGRAAGRTFDAVRWERLPDWLGHPLVAFDRVYRWRTQLDGDELLRRLKVVVEAFGLPGGVYPQDPAIAAHFGNTYYTEEMRFPLFIASTPPDAHAEFGVNVAPTGSGLVIYPAGYGVISIEQEVAESVTLEIRGNADFNAGVALVLEPPARVRVLSDLFSAPLDTVDTRIDVTLRRAAPDRSLTLLFGTPDASRLGFRELALRFIAEWAGGQGEVAAELEVGGLTAAIATDEADGFIQKVLSGIRVEAEADLALGISSADGVYFRGSGALDLELPLHLNLGPVRVDSLFLGVGIGDELALRLGASLGIEIGPIQGSVDRIGVAIPVAITEDGNLGPIEVGTPRFVPPRGAGLAIDAGGLVGGGYLELDHENGQYAGILELSFGEIGLVAIGLIATRLPDGSRGFSLLISISVVFDPPIQLSFGFTLSGVGGLVGIHRSMVVDALRDGLKQRTLDSILFPRDAIANASKIISDLRTVFPPEQGRFVIGPMIKLGWGSPNIIQANVGLFLELPLPIDIVILGQVAAELPADSEPVIAIHLDVIGAYSQERQQITVDATLYDSRMLTFTLTGGAGFLLDWSSRPLFAMSLGGFHPAFKDIPSGFIVPDRLGLHLGLGDFFQLSCVAYMALTSNSFQFGASMTLYASAGPVEVYGHMGFDALFQFSPFQFVTSYSAAVAIRWDGHTLAAIGLFLELSGPRPWHAIGRASFSILFIEVEVEIEVTFGPSDAAVLDPVDPWPPLMAALSERGSLEAALPPHRRMVEALREPEDLAFDEILVHPAGSLAIRQKVLPYNVRLSKLGNAPVRDHVRFWVEDAGLTAGGEPMVRAYEKDWFARNQIEELSRADQLAKPSFERFDAIVRGGSGEVEIYAPATSEEATAQEPFALRYETTLIEATGLSTSGNPAAATAPWSAARVLLRQGARARSAHASQGPRKFTTPDDRPEVQVRDEGYAIVRGDDLTLVSLDAAAPPNDGTMTRTEADQALADHIAAHPDERDAVLVVEVYEVAA